MTSNKPIHPFFEYKPAGGNIVFFQLYYGNPFDEHSIHHAINGAWFHKAEVKPNENSEMIYIKANPIDKTMLQFRADWLTMSKLAGISTHGWFFRPASPIPYTFHTPGNNVNIPWQIHGHSIRSYKPSFEMEDMEEQKLYATVPAGFDKIRDEDLENFLDNVYQYGLEMGMHDIGGNRDAAHSPTGWPYTTISTKIHGKRLILTTKLQRDV